MMRFDSGSKIMKTLIKKSLVLVLSFGLIFYSIPIPPSYAADSINLEDSLAPATTAEEAEKEQSETVVVEVSSEDSMTAPQTLQAKEDPTFEEKFKNFLEKLTEQVMPSDDYKSEEASDSRAQDQEMSLKDFVVQINAQDQKIPLATMIDPSSVDSFQSLLEVDEEIAVFGLGRSFFAVTSADEYMLRVLNKVVEELIQSGIRFDFIAHTQPQNSTSSARDRETLAQFSNAARNFVITSEGYSSYTKYGEEKVVSEAEILAAFHEAAAILYDVEQEVIARQFARQFAHQFIYYQRNLDAGESVALLAEPPVITGQPFDESKLANISQAPGNQLFGGNTVVGK